MSLSHLYSITALIVIPYTKRLFPLTISVTAYQQPNAKKLRRIAQKAEQLAAKGVLPRRQKRLLNRRPADKTVKKAEANNNPDREFYSMWGDKEEEGEWERGGVRTSGDDPILALTVFPLWKCEDQREAQMNVV